MYNLQNRTCQNQCRWFHKHLNFMLEGFFFHVERVQSTSEKESDAFCQVSAYTKIFSFLFHKIIKLVWFRYNWVKRVQVVYGKTK